MEPHDNRVKERAAASAFPGATFPVEIPFSNAVRRELMDAEAFSSRSMESCKEETMVAIRFVWSSKSSFHEN